MNIISKLVRVFQSRSLDSDTINPAAWFELGGRKKLSKQQLYYGIVYSCIDAIASNVSSIQPHLYEQDNDGSPDEVFEHDALAPLKKANAFQSGSDVLYALTAYIQIEGMGYLWPRKNILDEAYPIELWALDPTKITVMKSDDFDHFIRGYVYRSGNMRIPFEVGEIIPIYRPNPWDQTKGISPLEMARLEIEADFNAQKYNNAFFERGAKPSGVLTTDEEISEPAWERLKKQWAEANERGEQSWKKTLFLENGLKYQQTATSQKDMDFIEQRKLSRDDILAIFKVPKVILAISDDVNRANAEAGEYVFAKYTLLPILRNIYEKLNSHYVSMFPNSQRLMLKFDNPVPDDVKMLAEVREKSVYKWKTQNEVRAEEGLDPMDSPAADTLFVPINMMPIDSADDESQEDEEDPKEEEKKKLGKMLTKEQKAENALSYIVKANTRRKRFLLHRRRYLKNRENQLALATRQLYTDLIREVRKTPIRKDETESPETIFNRIMPTLDNFKAVAAATFLRYATETFEQGLKDVNTYFEFPVNFELVNSGAINYLTARANDTANSVRETMLGKARKVIAQEMEKPGFTLEKAKKSVLKVFKNEEDWRVMRIAKTETHTAYAQANYRAYVDSKMVEKLKWLVNDPCDICKANEGAVVPIGEAFPSGHTVEPAHPNCECETVPFFGI